MPKILEERVRRLLRTGMSRSMAYAIATRQLQSAGKLKKGTRKLATKKKRKNRKAK